jgi:hypothetical protein|tara:strand:+ start:786 stop:1064 length:279 start_codon:yes stop_codon:yes gene_type:complete
MKIDSAQLQYIEKDAVLDFIIGMDEVDTEAIINDNSIQELLNGSVPQKIKEHANPLGMVESFLQLFIAREEYELCQTLVDKHPQLKRSDIRG